MADKPTRAASIVVLVVRLIIPSPISEGSRIREVLKTDSEMVYREPNPNPCATAAPVRVARSKGYLSIRGVDMSWAPGRRVFRNAIAANGYRRRHPIDPPPQGLRRDKPANAECNAPSASAKPTARQAGPAPRRPPDSRRPSTGDSSPDEKNNVKNQSYLG
jgi:hypothetical protein